MTHIQLIYKEILILYNINPHLKKILIINLSLNVDFFNYKYLIILILY